MVLEHSVLSVSGVGFDMTADLTGLSASLLTSTWHPEFGLSEANICLVRELTSATQAVIFSWILK